MRRPRAAVLVIGLFLVGGSVWAQAPATQQAVRGPGARFIDANGDGVCDNFGAGGGFGRGAGRFGGGPGAGGMGMGMGRGFGGGFAFGPSGNSLVDVVARTTGQDRTAVAAALNSGKSLAQIGQDAGKSVQDLVEAVMAERAPAVGQAVSSGRLTQAQADQLLTTMRSNVELNLTGEWQGRGRGMGGLCPLWNRTGAAAATR
jgi:hypothetical protein